MVNYNGTITDQSLVNIEQNRGFLYGDCVFETIKVLNSELLFWEDHYFRLMASMRIVRMEIPMEFTPEYLSEQIFALLATLPQASAYRIRFTVFRTPGGYYNPTSPAIQYLITASVLEQSQYHYNSNAYWIDLYKDFYVTPHLLSTLKTNNRMINITGSIFASENQLANCVLLNSDKNVVETLQENIFIVKDGQIITPPLAQGCINGVMRKQIIRFLNNQSEMPFTEQAVTTFDLQKCDEVFLTNVIKGIQPVSHYRKQNYGNTTSRWIFDALLQGM